MHKASQIKGIQNWPGSSETVLLYRPHKCAYCGGLKCDISGEDTQDEQYSTVLLFEVFCHDCGRVDRPGLPKSALLSILMQIG